MEQYLTRSEGLSTALIVLKSPNSDKREKVLKTRPIIEALVGQRALIKDTSGKNSFALGSIVSTWKGEELWKEIDECREYWQFGHFCKEILGMSLQKVNAIIRIYDVSQKIGLLPEEVDKVGWVKANEIIRVARNRNEVDTWLQEAEWLNQEDFLAKVRSKLSGTVFNPLRKYRKLFKFTKDEVEYLDETIELTAEKVLGKHLGTEESPSGVLIFIITDWRLNLAPDKYGIPKPESEKNFQEEDEKGEGR